MTRVYVKFGFTAGAKLNGDNLDRIMAAVREWSAGRFGADHLSIDVRHESDPLPPLAERLRSDDIVTKDAALTELKAVLQIVRDSGFQISNSVVAPI